MQAEQGEGTEAVATGDADGLPFALLAHESEGETTLLVAAHEGRTRGGAHRFLRVAAIPSVPPRPSPARIEVAAP